MCKRVAQFSSPAELIEALAWKGAIHLQQPAQPQSGIEPQTAMGLVHAESDRLVFDLVRWGWCPRWANVQSPQAHAPVDKVTHSPYWKPVWQHRALCPIDGWFEWHGEDAESRRPYYIRRRDGRACLVAAAGQFPRDGREANPDDGFVLLVAEQRGGLVDERAFRPVVLSPKQAQEWLDSNTDKSRAEAIAQQSSEPDEAFEWFALDYDPSAQQAPSIEQLRKL